MASSSSWAGWHPAALQAVGLGQLHEVRAAVQRRSGNTAGRRSGSATGGPCPDVRLLKITVMTGQPVVLHGAQLVAVHAEAAVAGACGSPLCPGCPLLGADGGPQAEAHGAEAAGGQELAGMVEVAGTGWPTSGAGPHRWPRWRPAGHFRAEWSSRTCLGVQDARRFLRTALPGGKESTQSFHSLWSYWGRRSSSAGSSTCRASPMMWWSVWTFLSISARSMSIWTILA